MLEQALGVIGLNITMRPGSPEESMMRITAINPCNPEMVTVSINKAITVAAAAVPTNHRVQIRSRFGTGAGVGEVIFDARQGARITIPTHTLRISGIYLGTVGPTVLLSAAAAYGSRPGLGEAPLTFTEAAVVVAAAATSPALAVPKYMSRVAWISADDPLTVPPPQATIQFSGEAAFTTIEQQLSPDAGVFRAVAAGMEFARIRNDGQDANFQLIYELCL